MLPSDLQSDFIAIADNVALRDEKNFVMRSEAIDFLEFNILDRIEGLLPISPSQGPLLALQQQAESLKQNLEAIDDRLFHRLRQEIRETGITGAAFKALVNSFVEILPEESEDSGQVGYDALDTFVNGLLHFQPMPSETLPLEPGMVFYQKTPARIIWDMAEKAQMKPGEIFVDLGSGMGQVSILMHLLTGAKTKGIEFEPSYCDYARACAADLHLLEVEFIQADAREADFSTGQVFFLYTPFEGEILAAVMQRLSRESSRRIRVFSYGPCTVELYRQAWLRPLVSNEFGIPQLAAFDCR